MKITFSKLGNYGGIGNQMFQYALLRAVSNNLQIEMKIPPGNYDLLRFNILKNFDLSNDYVSFNEKFYHYDSQVFEIKQNIDFLGYYQSYKYFDKLREILLSDFSFEKNIDNLSENILNDIKDKFCKEIISIHIRRGDYLNYPDIHPVITKRYIETCIKYFDNFGKFCYLIFSDDIPWCRENLLYNNLYFSESNDNLLDLCLMSKCNHNIIANSSFSWWGAWLNKHKDKIIKYPNIWFGKSGPQDVQDLIPPNWEKENI